MAVIMTNRIVIDRDQTWIDGHGYRTPAGVAADPQAIADLIGRYQPQVAVTPHHPAELGNYLGAAYAQNPTQGGWLSLKHTDGSYLHIGQSGQDDPIITGPAGGIEHTLNRWQLYTGTQYRISPAVTAIASIRATGRRMKTQPRWQLQHKATAEWWRPPGQITDIRWKHQWCTHLEHHHYDMRAAYLAAAAAVDLPRYQLKQTDPFADPYSTVGYYRIVNQPGPLYDMLGRPDQHGSIWVCHPTLRALLDLGQAPVIVEAWTHDNYGRILRPWAEQWRDFLTVAERNPAERAAVKAGYAQALGGLLAVRSGTIYRPDWRHMIMDQVRASLLRRIVGGGDIPLPCAVDVDSLYYAPDYNPDLKTGDHVGNMRYQGVK